MEITQNKHFTAYKSIEIALKYTKMTKSKKTSKTRKKFDFRMEPKITTLIPPQARFSECDWLKGTKYCIVFGFPSFLIDGISF